MQHSILEQGIDLMLFGMGTVFLFLTLLVIATAIMSAIIKRYFPDQLVPQHAAPAPSVGTDPANNRQLLAILQSAVDQHRAKNK